MRHSDQFQRKLVLLCFIALLPTGCGLFSHDSEQSLDNAGGTVTSADHSVSVHATTGQADQGTRVQIATGRGGAPPPPLFRPLTRPFDIKVTAGRLRSGTVTVRIPEGTTLSQPGNVVMLIQHGSSGWQLLRTTVNVGARTASAYWPHFSKGWLGTFDPLFSPVATAEQWSWRQVKAGASWAGDEAKAFGKFIGGGALALLGGTARPVKCTPDSQDWTFAGTNSAGGHMTFPPLDGCAEPEDQNTGSWRVHVGNRYPYPYLLDLPAGTAPPYFSDIPASTDLSDQILSYVWGMEDHVVIPGGGNNIVRLGPTQASHVEMNAMTDPSTLAVKVLSLAALYYTGGDTAAMKAEIRAETEALDQAFIASRKQGDTTMTLSDYIYETRWDSPLARKQRKLAATTTAAAADQFFNDVDLLNCALGVRAKYRAANGGAAAAMQAVLDQMLDQCWPTWARATVLNTVAGATASQNPDAQAAESAHVVKGLIEQAKDIPRLALASDSALLKFMSHNRFDYTKVALQASRAGIVTEQFRPFGLSQGNFTWQAQDDQVMIDPPLGADRYSALWGVSDGAQRCKVTVDLDSALNGSPVSGNFGFAIAPLSTVQADQPDGPSVQYEHEAPPDFPAAGSFVRPALLPGGAWRVDVSPQPAPDIYGKHHIRVTDSGQSISIAIDGHQIAAYSHDTSCGGLSIRAWGAPFAFTSIAVS
jgi:hypothetical protein